MQCSFLFLVNLCSKDLNLKAVNRKTRSDTCMLDVLKPKSLKLEKLFECKLDNNVNCIYADIFCSKLNASKNIACKVFQ